jgi:hypothetical protein
MVKKGSNCVELVLYRSKETLMMLVFVVVLLGFIFRVVLISLIIFFRLFRRLRSASLFSFLNPFVCGCLFLKLRAFIATGRCGVKAVIVTTIWTVKASSST